MSRAQTYEIDFDRLVAEAARLPAVLHGGRTFISRADLDRLLDGRLSRRPTVSVLTRRDQPVHGPAMPAPTPPGLAEAVRRLGGAHRSSVAYNKFYVGTKDDLGIVIEPLPRSTLETWLHAKSKTKATDIVKRVIALSKKPRTQIDAIVGSPSIKLREISNGQGKRRKSKRARAAAGAEV